MATKPSSGLRLKLEERLTCPVCLDYFTNPKILPCHHSFCQHCLEGLPLDKMNETYYLSCPTCRHCTELPEEGVGDFPVAFHLNDLKEIHRIQKISMDGYRIASVGQKGSGPLQFKYPRGIAISPILGHFYIADEDNHRIQVLNPDLTFSHSFGSRGSANGQFQHPRDIAIDNQGLIYMESLWVTFGTEGSGPGQLNTPVGIAIDTAATSLVYVSELGNNRISVFTSDGVFVSSFGRWGSNNYKFYSPYGLTFDEDEFLYVCDHDNGQLVVY
ncbi:PREDICTED: RING finger protein nhl-1-like [Amphimedon queenslandica]|uniref:RING-type domain-containing protein n=1 Tax=Amphimedon queenslandica TaxID=400682 RepID=A0AAN0IQL6_AMPQE|nr:PREDICTED: RING finger protein nhl-1-like [Amphimedon queenslandica]|eukprot:XP_011406387.1 PREDICTED: RING finger protein nhl-1-like [Amphimedon queenslandica]